jgi:hypothetical protein
MAVPPRLYKYEPCNGRTLQNIKGQILYFGSPLNFNDPYDCALTPNFRAPTDDEVESTRAFYLSQGRLTDLQREEFEKKTTDDLRGLFLRAAREALEQQISEVLRNRGITCFSERNDDLLMWSHYTGRGRGVCLEFDTQIEPFSKTRPVRYVSALPQLDVADILMQGNLDPVLDLFCTKSSSWRYEREWRALHRIGGTQYIYPAAALTGVYFGPDIDGESLEIVCLILAGQNESVKLYRGSRSTTEFRVLFEEFTYTSYLRAKKMGLRE